MRSGKRKCADKYTKICQDGKVDKPKQKVLGKNNMKTVWT